MRLRHDWKAHMLVGKPVVYWDRGGWRWCGFVCGELIDVGLYLSLGLWYTANGTQLTPNRVR